MTSTTDLPTTAGRREWAGLAVLCLACMLATMDMTVLFLAAPAISADLDPSSTELLWITDLYGFLIAGSLITMGTLGDRIGRRRLLLWGAAAFGLASVFAAFATSPAMLILARGLLGIAGATLAPSTLSLLTSMFSDDKQRTVAIGIWGSSFAAGAAVGPLVGGALLSAFWWGSVFLAAVPVMVLILVAGPRLLPEFRREDAGRLDPLSAVMSLAAVLLAIYGLKEIARDGVAAVPAGAVVLGLAVGLAFLRRQRRLADPLVDLTMFRTPAFSVALGVNASGAFVAFGTGFLTAQYLQLELGMGALEAGLWSLPSSLVVIVSGMALAPAVSRRFSPASIIVGGLAIAGLGALGLACVESGLAFYVAGSTLMSGAFGVIFTVTFAIILGAAAPEHAGAASGVAETGGEFGGALGIALLGSLATAVTSAAGSLGDGLQVAALAAAAIMLAGACVAGRVLRGFPGSAATPAPAPAAG